MFLVSAINPRNMTDKVSNRLKERKYILRKFFPFI